MCRAHRSHRGVQGVCTTMASSADSVPGCAVDSAADNADGFASFIAWDNLCTAWQRAALGKRTVPAVARFELAPGDKLVRLHAALAAGTWQPGGYASFAIHEPKRRWISAAPFVDRVVHHALMAVIQPRFDASFIADSCANRPGKGTHKAAKFHDLGRRPHHETLPR